MTALCIKSLYVFWDTVLVPFCKSLTFLLVIVYFQVITALLNHITRGSLPFSVEKGGKMPAYFFKSNSVDDISRKKEADKEKKTSKRRKSNSESARKKELAEENLSDKDGLKFKEEFKEDKLLIYKNNFVRGVMDKAQFGDYGIVHTVHELYGSNTAGLLLSAFSRLFTAYLQVIHFFWSQLSFVSSIASLNLVCQLD